MVQLGKLVRRSSTSAWIHLGGNGPMLTIVPEARAVVSLHLKFLTSRDRAEIARGSVKEKVAGYVDGTDVDVLDNIEFQKAISRRALLDWRLTAGGLSRIGFQGDLDTVKASEVIEFNRENLEAALDHSDLNTYIQLHLNDASQFFGKPMADHEEDAQGNLSDGHDGSSDEPAAEPASPSTSDSSSSVSASS